MFNPLELFRRWRRRRVVRRMIALFEDWSRKAGTHDEKAWLRLKRTLVRDGMLVDVGDSDWDKAPNGDDHVPTT